jgi:hypothetical protein
MRQTVVIDESSGLRPNTIDRLRSLTKQVRSTDQNDENHVHFKVWLDHREKA